MMKNYTFLIIVSVTLFGYNPASRAQQAAKGDTGLIKIETSLGDLVVRLYNETPEHRINMLKLISEEFYQDHLFHRVIKDFMIQGGDPHSVNADKGQRLGTGGPGYTIPAEFNENLFHKKGAIAAARPGDQVNPEKRSSGSQFYIVQGRVFSLEELKFMEQQGIHAPFSNEAMETYTSVGGTPHLDGAYTVFGEVIEGLNIIDTLASVTTDTYDRPLDDIVYTISVVK